MTSLSERLDAMLLDWLERSAARGLEPRPGLEASAVLTVSSRALEEVQRFCGLWGLRTKTVPRDDGRSSVLRIDGPSLVVEGVAAIATGRAR
jgi:hypothetical protein